ncbi:MAG: formylglycine-generating enzyme family protein [Saprospiraceae bacterium]|nr:formylglycine-generating enzyme family protein [Saprospiraceae bacterium]
MGDTFNEGSESEKPVHAVTVSGFYLGKTEVTFDEYDAFCTATGREKPGDAGWGRGQRPVINVDWYDAVEYCNWRSIQDKLQPVYTIDKTRIDPNNYSQYDNKKWTVSVDWRARGYRLPTEAEWEYAARATPSPPGEGRGGVGGGQVRFGNGKDLADPSQMNFNARADYKAGYSVVGECRAQTVPVGSLRTPNALGLHDMAGNVWEWCQDWYDAGYYAQSAGATNPSGPGSGSFRVRRGGSWGATPLYCRSAFRSYPDPGDRGHTCGLRLALSLQ